MDLKIAKELLVVEAILRDFGDCLRLYIAAGTTEYSSLSECLHGLFLEYESNGLWWMVLEDDPFIALKGPRSTIRGKPGCFPGL